MRMLQILNDVKYMQFPLSILKQPFNVYFAHYFMKFICMSSCHRRGGQTHRVL